MSENTSDKSPHNAPWVNEKVGGWKTKSTRIAYENPWIRVSHNEVITPTGTDGIYGVVHFKNIAIGILPLDEAYNTWVVGQYRFPTKNYSWEIVEGGGPLGNDPLDSAKRELAEETGLSAKNFIEIQRMHLSNSVSDELAIVYIAKDLQFGEATPEETEQLMVKKLPFTAAYQMVIDGLITDSISVAAILKTKILIVTTIFLFSTIYRRSLSCPAK